MFIILLFLCCLKVKWIHVWEHVPIISCKHILQNVNAPPQIETALIKYSVWDVNAVFEQLIDVFRENT